MSYAEIITDLNHLMWWLLIACIFVFLISGLDELFFDLVYWGHFVYLKWKNRNKKLLTHEELTSLPEKKIAIIVACWHEHLVIGGMLHHNVTTINYKNYDFFVGVYPNDPETIAAVKQVQEIAPNIHCAICPNPGPTSKADNLNSIYELIMQYEKDHNVTYEIFVMHDSEDVMHPLSLKLCNYMFPQNDMLQTPVLPLEVKSRHFTHWIYNDEFAELHTKDIIVRGLIKGFIPSAGVGTAFSRVAIKALAQHNGGQPFKVGSLTEDYNSALRLKILNLQAAFYAHTITRVQKSKRWIFFGKLVPRRVKELVATRSLFPMRYRDAIRQRSRWVLGITLQEWAEAGWPGDLSVRYTLAHDRKAIITHLINGVAYFVFLYWLMDYLWNGFYPGPPVLTQLLKANPWAWYLIITCTFLMFERALQRLIATSRIYNFWHGLLSIPRVFYANILNTHTSIIALRTFIGGIFGWAPIKWAKTTNVFPSEVQLSVYKRKLGDLLIEKKWVTPLQMAQALDEQTLTGDLLGQVLLKLKYINLTQLTEALAEQTKSEIALQEEKENN